MELEFESVGFQEKGKTGVPGENPGERTNKKINSHMAYVRTRAAPHGAETNGGIARILGILLMNSCDT